MDHGTKTGKPKGMNLKIAIMGTGAMGSVYAGLLGDAGNEVWAIDVWQDHVDAMNSQGLRVEGASGDRTARLRFVRAPSLVIHGTVDPLLRPIGGQLTAQAIPDARLELIEGMGHDYPPELWQRWVDEVATFCHRHPG